MQFASGSSETGTGGDTNANIESGSNVNRGGSVRLMAGGSISERDNEFEPGTCVSNGAISRGTGMSRDDVSRSMSIGDGSSSSDSSAGLVSSFSLGANIGEIGFGVADDAIYPRLFSSGAKSGEVGFRWNKDVPVADDAINPIHNSMDDAVTWGIKQQNIVANVCKDDDARGILGTTGWVVGVNGAMTVST